MLVGQGEAANSCHFVIRSSIAQKCNYHGTRFCADVHVSVRLFVAVAACVDRLRRLGEEQGPMEKFDAILRRVPIFVKSAGRAYLCTLAEGKWTDSPGRMTVVSRTRILASN